MWLPSVGLIIGLIIGSLFPFSIPVLSAKYLAVTALCAIDFIFVGFKARLNNHFNTAQFVIEFILNTIIAIGLVYLGDIMNVDLFMAVAIVLSARIFYNISSLNHLLFYKNSNIM
ncbi:MAG: hypothetical protein ACD_20C00409G0003 [uncultured bacterium]|nr:MAG: hypothetical protein ACD_20C00409G0003 [uncultured bacterium]HBH18626.1 DUF1290 domain-containing protein [Cyanobacteria bacterium UBA9579]